MKPKRRQQQNNNNNNGKSKFVRTRNQNKDIPLSASKIKKRIRDVKRTLTKGKHVSAQVITESKRRLRVLEYELGERVVDEAEKKNLTTYHMVRHFERKKAERKLRAAQREFDAETDPVKKEKKERDLYYAQMNLYYVLHYPKTVPYVSLYPKENESNPISVTRKERILNDIKETHKNGDTDFKEMQKRYRAEYKQRLIDRGVIQPEAPVAVDEDVEMVKKEEQEGNSSGDSEDDKDEVAAEDDFFEKA